MTELSLFSDPTPPATEIDDSAPASGPGDVAAEPGRGGLPSEQLLAMLDALVVGLDGLGGGRLEECLRLLGRCEARLAAVKADKVAELARWRGEAHAAAVLRGDLKQSRGGARREVEFAERLGDLPKTAKALADGDVTPQAARAIADAAAHTRVDEDELLDAAGTEPADVFARTVRDHLNERTAGEDLAERRRRQRARRELSIKQQSDGMYKLFGLFDPVAGARIQTALDAAARKIRRGEDSANRATVPQRYADALELLATANDAAGAQHTTLLLIAHYDAVAGRIAGAHLPDGTPVSADELVRLAVKAKVVPAVFDTPGRPLWLGRACRDANAAQRIALAARDGRCVGCGARHNICEPHHEEHWEHGGPTDIDNMCLLCGPCHHTEIHDNGGDIEKAADGKRTLRHATHHRSDTKHRRRSSTNPTVNQPLRI